MLRELPALNRSYLFSISIFVMKDSFTVKEERNVVHKIERRNFKWVVQVLGRNCLLEHVTEGKID